MKQVFDVRKIKKVNSCIALFLLVLLSMTGGCGVKYSEPDPEKGSLILSEDGSMELELKRSFTEDYYSEAELQEYTNGQIAAYNGAKGGERIVLRTCTVKDGAAQLTLYFASWEDYAAFMPTALYAGTVQGAYDAGFDFDQALSKASNPERVIGKNDLMGMAKERILVVEGDLRISVPDDIENYTFGMKAIDKKTVESSGDGVNFILY